MRWPVVTMLFLAPGAEDGKTYRTPATVAGLDPATQYYFRVVATNANGTTIGPDQPVETLNEDGLTQGRRYELVSPADKGPVGVAGIGTGLNNQVIAQPSSDGGGLAYLMGFGATESTSGGEVAFMAKREAGGWASSQLSPSSVGNDPLYTPSIAPTREVFVAPDHSCGFLLSGVALTDDPVAKQSADVGIYNIYRRNSDGSLDLVPGVAPTNLPPVTTGAVDLYQYTFHGVTPDCDRVVFSSMLKYPGVDFSGGSSAFALGQGSGLYLWDDDSGLENLGVIPGPSGPEVAVPAKLGAPPGQMSGAVGSDQGSQDAVSEDLRRVFFTAISKVGGDIDREAVFMREDGETTVDVSQSQTATPNDDNARYQMTTPDGGHVFFTGRYGLASNGTSTGATTCNQQNGAGCDLYRYSAATGTLTDVSAASDPANTQGAGVVGVLNLSDDGSRVYFAARGQLVPGKGKTQAQNLAGTRGYNLYLWDSGTLSYVATVPETDAIGGGGGGHVGLLASYLNTNITIGWRSGLTPSGSHLLFQSTGNLTGENASGRTEAYRYSAGSGELVCVSCRRDGLAPNPSRQPLPGLEAAGWELGTWRPLKVISDDGSRVLFYKADPLAPGAPEGSDHGLFEWHDGQISLLAATDNDDPSPGSSAVRMGGASDDMDSVFFTTPQSLVGQDFDGRQDFYVARVGGGFADPPAPPTPCDPLSDGSCQGPGAPGSGGGDAETSKPSSDGDADQGARAVVSVGRFSAAARRALASGRSARLRLVVNRPGAVKLAATARIAKRVRRVGSSSTRARKAGSVSVPLRLSRSALVELGRRGELRVRVAVSLTGARPGVVSVVVKAPPTKRNGGGAR